MIQNNLLEEIKVRGGAFGLGGAFWEIIGIEKAANLAGFQARKGLRSGMVAWGSGLL